jgi:hypothetical protein
VILACGGVGVSGAAALAMKPLEGAFQGNGFHEKI